MKCSLLASTRKSLSPADYLPLSKLLIKPQEAHPVTIWYSMTKAVQATVK